MSTITRGSDTMSEVSSRTSTYSGSREDLADIVVLLGLTRVDQVAQERFRVDRRKLENMLIGEQDVTQHSETSFFQKVMNETNTHITWPSRLKIGAKSKKDPHIRVAGRSDDVKTARDKIMSVLDSRSNRVTMKLDVSYTDHSHIIGKGGQTIKHVMEDTGCHIHFPDSNRSNPMEKSNQVSIAGDLEGVEKARARVRELTPLIFSFELPIVGATQHNHPAIGTIQEMYNVQVMFRTQPKLHSTLVLVKGCEWEVERVKEATLLLINKMCESLANQVSVHMMMEISPQHHHLVLGWNHENLKKIMKRTGTQIIFPDALDPDIPSIKKSNVTITGTIHNVYLARQQIVGSLPLVLMFDMAIVPETEKVNQLMNSLDIVISMRHKPKQNIVTVIIKGIERNASSLYEARNQLLAITNQRVVAYIPSAYAMPNAGPTFNLHACPEVGFTGNFSNMDGNFAAGHNHRAPEPMNPWQPPSHPYYLLSPHNHHHLLMHTRVPTHHHQPNRHFSYSSLSLPDTKDVPAAYSSLSSTNSTMSSPAASPRNVSPVDNIFNEQPKFDVSSLLNDLTDRRAPGIERQSFTPFDYQQLKLQAAHAIQNAPNTTDVRVPTSSWSGYGFSQSSPTAVLKEKKMECGLTHMADTNWDVSESNTDHTTDNAAAADVKPLSASNYLDFMPSSTLSSITSSNADSMASLLTSLDLCKYIQLFKSHEIDLSTFRTFTEFDLREIGVTAFGARRKMILAISELNKRQGSGFRAAPGAERQGLSLINKPSEQW